MEPPPPALTVRGREFRWGSRTYVMGIVNTTPDSFSGDGIGADPEAAVRLAKRMEAEGADWLDIGGESSRPGADELDPAEEARRVIPCLEAVRASSQLPISIDTYHPEVARTALAAGADAVNDIWGLRRDPAMARVAAEAGAAVFAMHNQRGRPAALDVMAAVRDGLRESLRIATAHGIPAERVVLDPGFGFGWRPEQNLEMLRRLGELRHLGCALLVGTSRKSTIGHVIGGAPVEERRDATATSIALAIANGADIVRVHEVEAMARAARMADAILGRGPMSGVTEVVIALGSNLGDRAANLRWAVRELEAAGLRVTRRSSIWETEPVPADQPAFLNAVVVATTTLPPAELLRLLKDLEWRAGRRPERRWGPRPLDLDILFYGEERVETETLTIPHPSILERAFVLAPLAQVWPGRLPVLGVAAAGVAKLEGVWVSSEF